MSRYIELFWRTGCISFQLAMTLPNSSPVSPYDKDSSIDLIYGDLKELDVGLALIVDREDEEVPLSLNESKRILRKVDMHVLPLLCLVFGGESMSLIIVVSKLTFLRSTVD